MQNTNNLTLIQVVKIWESLLENGTICSPPYQPLGVSLVTQLVKNPPARQETPIGFLGREDHLEKGQTTDSSIPFPGGSAGKESTCSTRDLGLKDPLEKAIPNPLQSPTKLAPEMPPYPSPWRSLSQ